MDVNSQQAEVALPAATHADSVEGCGADESMKTATSRAAVLPRQLGATHRVRHTNLVPNYYQLDDFQVRTPTDIIGQHIHLVKFDVTSSDGAGNGFNYEDGTFAPGEVQEIITAINAGGGLQAFNSTTKTQLTAKPPPAGISDSTCAANAEIVQAVDWRAGPYSAMVREPLPDNQDMERTLGTVFTHDHFGPSTHQQAGLYGGLLAEPAGSIWESVDGKITFGSRDDGGPTSWQANILTPNKADSYREFALEFRTSSLPIRTPLRRCPILIRVPDPAIGFRLLNTYNNQYSRNVLPGVTPTTPQLISASFGDPVLVGTMSLNYQQAPVSFRIQPNDPSSDLSYVFSSLRSSTNPQAPLLGDPSTPLLRAYKTTACVCARWWARTSWRPSSTFAE